MRLLNKRVFCVLLYAVLAVPLWPEEALVLTLEDAVSQALTHNLSIRRTRLDLESKKLIRDTVFNQFYPRITASATLSRLHEAPGTVSGLIPVPPDSPPGSGIYDYVATYEQEIPHTWNLSTNIQASLTLTFQLVGGIELAFMDYERGLETLEKARKQVERDVRKAFYQLILSREQLSIMEESLKAAEARYQQTERLFQNGLVDRQTLLSARVAWESMKPQIAQLSMAYENALLNFKMLLGMDLEHPVVLEGEITTPALSLTSIDLSRFSLDRSPEIQELVKALQMQRIQRQITASSRLPVLTFTLTADPTFQGDPFADPWFEDMDTMWKQRSGMFGITVTVPVDPWIPASQTWVNLSNQDRTLEAMELQLEEALRGTYLKVRSLLDSIRTAQENLKAHEANLELARTSYQLAEEAYGSGLKDLVAVMDAETQLRQAQFSVLSDRIQILTNLIDLSYTLNVPFETFIGGQE
ncbi:outer membrane efflux protein [Spirochaeta thermophila DSM 6578]|uniref:Outer membrane efflux protein n=1 Tax=Winmispira thermophila (strain ATCC 700085 / DSM 6578 / Z-1203) TaxID=869211 RepID=G0GFZ1_WINT7|nr:TolC family protein [Spirochaeta thermophila]AEJ62467.1 outer membrane efflux protein [Spirochaeta thermophila DSM 6578]